MAEDDTEDRRLLDRLRAILLRRALTGETVGAEPLAAEAEADPKRLPDLLERMIREDHAAGRPLLAALAVCGEQGSPITQRFFDVLRALGRYDGAAQGPEASEWLALEREDAIARHRAEQEAYAEMVDWLAGRMSIFSQPILDAPPRDLVGHVVHHGFQSNMEEMAWTLQDIGILENIPADPADQAESDRFLEAVLIRQKPPARRIIARFRIFLRDILRSLRLIPPAPVRLVDSGLFRFVVPRAQVREMARKAYEAETPSFEQVLYCFIDNAAGYSSLPSKREAFTSAAEFIPVMEPLSRLDYATKVNDLYRWKDPIGPAMVAAYCWTDDGQNRTDVQIAAVHRLIREMPDRVKQHLSSFFPRAQELNAMAYLHRKAGWTLPAAKDAVDILYAEWRADWQKANRRS